MRFIPWHARQPRVAGLPHTPLTAAQQARVDIHNRLAEILVRSVELLDLQKVADGVRR